MLCRRCGREVEPRDYCAYCGAHLLLYTSSLATAVRGREKRSHMFASNPGEHLYHLSIVSTFFPHLTRQRTHQVRWLLFAGVAFVLLVSAGRFVPLAILLAALLMPIFYLVYFFDTQLFGNEPFRILGATFALGALLGGVMEIALFRFLLAQYRAGAAPTTGYVLLTGLLLPLLAQVLMLAGPLVLYFTRPRFDELLDGLAFGAASGLGFSASASIISAWLLIIGPFAEPALVTAWVVPILRIGLLAPLVNAATTGLICAALWLRRDPTPPIRELGRLSAWPTALACGVAGQVAPSLLSALVPGIVAQLIWYALTVVGITLLLRQLLHSGLMEKARALGHGQRLICPECHHNIADTPFCPYCGLALLSISRRMRRPLLSSSIEEPT